jgi:hypothetical protein
MFSLSRRLVPRLSLRMPAVALALPRMVPPLRLPFRLPTVVSGAGVASLSLRASSVLRVLLTTGVAVVGLSGVVIKTGDIERLRECYALLGLSFVEEKHGNGQRHYSTVINGTGNARTTASAPHFAFTAGSTANAIHARRCVPCSV